MVTTGHPGCRGSPPHTTQSPAPRQHCSCLSLHVTWMNPPGPGRGSRSCTNSAALSSVLTSAFRDGTGVLLSTGPAPPTQPSLTKAGSTGQGEKITSIPQKMPVMANPLFSHCLTCTVSSILTVLSLDKHITHLRDEGTETSRGI